jgi:hypothetical protein
MLARDPSQGNKYKYSLPRAARAVQVTTHLIFQGDPREIASIKVAIRSTEVEFRARSTKLETKDG